MRAYKEDLANFLESLARSMRSGASLRGGLVETLEAFEELELNSDLAGDLNQLKRHLESNVLTNQALAEWSQKNGSLEIAKTKSVLSFGTDFGGQKARAFEALAYSFRRDIATEQELESLTAQARTSALVIAALPLGFFFIFSSLDSDFLSFLFTTPLGITCLVLGVALDLTGAWWMKRILDKCV